TDYNFMFQCLQYYLSQSTNVEAPIANLVSKNNLMRIGDSYVKFFKEVFSDPENLNDWVEKSPLVAQAKEELGGKFISAQRFNDNVKLYVAAHKDLGWTLELKKRKNSQQNAVPHFYIGTNGSQAVETEPVDIQQPATNV